MKDCVPVPTLVTEPLPARTAPKVALAEPPTVRAMAEVAALVREIDPPVPVRAGTVTAETLEPKLRVPAETARPPTLTAPFKTRLPAPAFVRVEDEPVTRPPTVSVLPETVSVRLPVRVTAPVPRFRLFVPVKVKSPVQACALFPESVTVEPVALSNVPPARVSKPLPRAPALPTCKVPAESVKPAVLVAALRASVPEPVLESAPKPAA